MAPSSPPYVSPWDGLPRVTQYGASGYLAARGLVAALGVLNVALVIVLGFAIGGLAALLSVSDDGVHWRATASAQGRAPVGEQPEAGGGLASQVLVTEGVTARGISVRQIAQGERRWGFAEIRIDELLPDSPE